MALYNLFKEKIVQKGSCGYRMCLTVVVLQETNRKPACYSQVSAHQALVLGSY